ncbi:hypothetical protein [Azospirillum soli]|uniref:hypothetical protein n=1 Tax=Azospirillum soli TaxID=1304799 RepID=UPI001AE0F0A0|nr:hypothetical protein [Azospirillum soli]MBP2315544.1 hypothetical protein [Azospirillum soli]
MYITDYRDSTVDDLSDDLKARMAHDEGVKLRDLRYWDITHDNGQPIAEEFGIYWVALDRSPLYIGKCTSLSFVERIGGHLSLGAHHWKNLLLRRHADIWQPRSGLVPQDSVETLADAQIGLLHIMRRGMPGDVPRDMLQEACKDIGRLEKALRGALKTPLTPAPPNEAYLAIPLDEALRHVWRLHEAIDA